MFSLVKLWYGFEEDPEVKCLRRNLCFKDFSMSFMLMNEFSRGKAISYRTNFKENTSKVNFLIYPLFLMYVSTPLYLVSDI